MRTLLDLAGVEAREEYTRLPHGDLFHLERGSGRALVLLQGAGGGAANWYRLMGPLSEGRRVLAVELPGFGLSDPIEIRAPLGVRAAEVLGEWLSVRLRGEPFDLVATSFGGLVALRLAAELPLRGRLVLINATGLGRGVCLPARLAGLPGLRALSRKSSRGGTALLLRHLLTTDRSRIPPAEERALIDYLWHTSRAGAGRMLADSLNHFAGVAGQREILSDAEFASITNRILILWGARDRFVPPDQGRRAAAVLPDARFELLDGVGHSPNWEDPDAVRARIQPFLDVA